MLLGTGRNLRPVRNITLQIILLQTLGRRPDPQVRKFGIAKLERKIVRKPVAVTPETFVETPRGYTVKAGQFGVEDDSVAANCEDQRFQVLDTSCWPVLPHAAMNAPRATPDDAHSS